MTNHKKQSDPIKIALLAVGGDGGGVLTSWITQLAEDNGYWAQYTYVAGVAQRTGATVYYLELFPLAALEGEQNAPVLAQMPAPQDVDILMATELMEAGRAVQRGFVSKKTTMIFSTNRNLAIGEKEVAGDGILDGNRVFEMTKKYAKQSLFGNLKLMATKHNSVISSSLFGALAASGALPFKKEAYQAVIQSGGKGIKQSLNAFDEGYQYIKDFIKQPKPYQPDLAPASFQDMPESSSLISLNRFISDIKQDLPEHVHSIVWKGVNHLIDFQGIDYAKDYLAHVKKIAALDSQEKNYLLTQQVARYLATAMAYDDIIFVSDEKTRKARKVSVYKQVGANEDDIVNTLDFLRPGYEELVGMMPVKMGKRFVNSEKWRQRYDKYLSQDRRLYSTGFWGFISLYIVGGLRGWRLKTLRHHDEMENIQGWLTRIQQAAANHYALAVALARSYRLKKGYSDTYQRGQSKFAMINRYAQENMDVPDIDEHINHLIAYALQHHDVGKTKQQIDDLSKSGKHDSQNL